MIQTNEKRKQNLTLVVKGYVKKFATIRPKRIQLTGSIDEKISQTVTIIPEKEYRFKIIETTAQQGNDIKLSLQEKQGDASVEYLLTVENIRREAGRYYDIIVLKTDNQLKPELQVRVYGNIMEPKKEDQPVSEPLPIKGTSGSVRTDVSAESGTGSEKN